MLARNAAEFQKQLNEQDVLREQHARGDLSYRAQESLGSLRFAQRARAVQVKVGQNEEFTSPEARRRP